jgi:type I restriction enzyme M protein
MAIVLPDSILSNPGLAFIRRWLLRVGWVIASIDLPRETFARSDTHTKTSVLILQKYTESERRLVNELGHTPDYEVFMAIAERVGWDLRGQPVYQRTPEGEEIMGTVKRTVHARNARGDLVELEQEDQVPIRDDHLPPVIDLFDRWLRSGAVLRWMNA